MNSKKHMWEYSIHDLTQGFAEEINSYKCLFCETEFSKGRIFQVDGQLYDSLGAILYHVNNDHGCCADYLIKQDCGLTGITPVQQQILQLMADGKDDKEISQILGIAHSTVRNHRFKLREKEKQARLFVALMSSLENKTSQPIGETEQGIIEEVPVVAKMIDDRYDITAQDREKTVHTYMDENGGLKQFPSKEKKKIILLGEIAKNFKSDVEYSERDINKVLKRIYDDFPTIRRALIEYGFMDRSDDGKTYRLR